VRSQERYVPGPLAAPAVLFRAVPPAAEPAADASLGWRGLTDLEVYDLPADHYSILRPPAVDELTRLLEHQMANRRGTC
jgi:thioesterase domain-containing protein